MLPKEIILASASPRRRELLIDLGVPFDVVTADIPELDTLSPAHPTPTALALENARRKANAVAALNPGRWILGADTVVALNDHLFGKPTTHEEAKSFLQALGGQTHEVITACVLVEPNGTIHEFHDTTQVTFKPLTSDIIDLYLAKVHVLDKAGAYALQEHGELIVEHVAGSRTNVIGLPTEVLERVFKSRGLL